MRFFLFSLNMIGALLLGLFACSRSSYHSLLHRVDTLLVANRPDSAMTLLKGLSGVEHLPQADQAYYAILLAATTDKLKLPLLPCDSLLDLALDYYGATDRERARALLYKARLLAQMDDKKAAIEHNLEALQVLQAYPEDTLCRRLIYSPLGLWYADCGLYDKALEVLERSLGYALNAEDTALAYDNIASVYFHRVQKDSSVAYHQKALDYARLSEDIELLIGLWHNLSLCYSFWEETDSAMVYAQKVIQYASLINKEDPLYFYNIGDLYADMEQYDSARYYLNKSLPFSQTGVSYWSLANVEFELGNFQLAYHYMDTFAIFLDSLYANKQVTEVQHLVYKHQTEMEVNRERVKARDRLELLIASFVVLCFVIIVMYRYRIYRRNRQIALSRQSVAHAEEKLAMMQQQLQENESTIALLQGRGKESADLVGRKEQLIVRLQSEILALRTWLFQQAPIYKKIVMLDAQKDVDKKARKVMTDAERAKLQTTIFGIYADYIAILKQQHTRLTDDDLLLLCLQEAHVSPLTIALCFGYSDTSTINQRKSRLKTKMS